MIKNFHLIQGIYFRNIQKLQIHHFSFKFDKKRSYKIPNLLDEKLLLEQENFQFSKVNEKIQKILKNYKIHKNVFNLDGKFYLRNIQFYKDYDIQELPIILEVLMFLCNTNVTEKEISETNSRSYKLEELADPDNLGANIPKSPYPMFESFRMILNKQINEGKVQLEDFTKIFNSFKKIPNCHRNFYFILSDCLKLYFNKTLSGAVERHKEKYSEKDMDIDMINYLNSNLGNFKILSYLPYGKITIGNFINLVLLNEIRQNKNSSKFSLSDEFISFMYGVGNTSSYNSSNSDNTERSLSSVSLNYKYDNEVYFNFILPIKSKILTTISESSIGVNLNILQSFLNSSRNQKNLNQLPRHIIEELDDVLANYVKQTSKEIHDKNSNQHSFNKNNFQINEVEKILNIFLNSEKSNMKEILFLPKFISSLNSVMLDYHKRNFKNQIFFDYFNPVRRHVYFYFKYYTEIKQYLYTDRKENLFLHKTFEEFNEVCSSFFEILKFHNLNKIQKFQLDEITSLLNPLQSAFFSSIKSETFDEFCLNFLIHGNVSSSSLSSYSRSSLTDDVLNKINFDTNFNSNSSKHKLLHKLILTILNINSKDHSEIITCRLNDLLEKYLHCYETEINSEEINFYFINLCTVLYNYLINSYKRNSSTVRIFYHLDYNLIKKMCHMLFKLIKYFSISESKYLRRIVLILENLKIIDHDIVLKNDSASSIFDDKLLRPKFQEIEKVFKQFLHTSNNSNRGDFLRKEIWWSKEYFLLNKYNIKDIENNLLGREIKFQTFPDLNNCYYSDFSISLKGKKQFYFEFLGSYHLNNYLDNPYNFSELNNKYSRKMEIYNNHKRDLIYIPFEKILDDIENLNKIILTNMNI